MLLSFLFIYQYHIQYRMIKIFEGFSPYFSLENVFAILTSMIFLNLEIGWQSGDRTPAFS